MEHKTNLLPIYSLQTNMLSAVINENNGKEVLVLLSNGQELKICCPTDYNANHIHNALHFYSVFEKRNNNSHEFDFYFTMYIKKQ